MTNANLTEEQAIRMYQSNWWAGMAPHDVAMFQLHEPRLCMPFAVFHAAVEQALHRAVYTHELADLGSLLAELLDEQPAPTMAEIIRLIPASKRVVIWFDGKVDGVPE